MKPSSETKLKDPPAEFVKWWEPIGVDADSGAHVGGHAEAERIWARKDPGHWFHRTYGIPARIAWNTACYHEEYLIWVQVGRPESIPPFTGIATSLAKQKEFWQGLKSILSNIGKPLPEPQLFDYDVTLNPS